jgi:hypothetical protein
MLRLLSIAPLFVLAIAGCSNNVDHATAQKVMTSALTASATANGKVTGASWTPSAAQVNISVTNPIAAGTATITGSASAANGVVTTNVDITLNHWVDPVENITLDGSLHEAGSFTTGLPLAGSVQIDGAIAASGSVNATVDLTLKGSYGPSGVSVDGSVGGNVINGSVSLSAH